MRSRGITVPREPAAPDLQATLLSTRSIFNTRSIFPPDHRSPRPSFGEKDLLSSRLLEPKHILSDLHVNVFPFAFRRFLQEVRNKSLSVDDNGVRAARVRHLLKSNSGGVSSDLFVY
ncbi:hypothetical protein KUCAC02_037645 [Chaenocephalus aceratus]|nr:hypothetical protein KUCAC02_037645 [Chaenocephalus aceratus]